MTPTPTTRSPVFVDGPPSGGLTLDHVLDSITLYWLTGTGASPARSYWENTQAAVHAAGQARPEVKLAAGVQASAPAGTPAWAPLSAAAAVGARQESSDWHQPGNQAREDRNG